MFGHYGDEVCSKDFHGALYLHGRYVGEGRNGGGRRAPDLKMEMEQYKALWSSFSRQRGNNEKSQKASHCSNSEQFIIEPRKGLA